MKTTNGSESLGGKKTKYTTCLDMHQLPFTVLFNKTDDLLDKISSLFIGLWLYNY